MNSLQKVSVCFLTYNSEKDNLEETVKNLLKLNYKNIEFVISDDNSIDKSFEICKKIVEKSIKNILSLVFICLFLVVISTFRHRNNPDHLRR